MLDFAELLGAIAQLFTHAFALAKQLPALLQFLLELYVTLALELQLLILLSKSLHESHVLCLHTRYDVVLVVELLLNSCYLVRIGQGVPRLDYLLQHVAQPYAFV